MNFLIFSNAFLVAAYMLSRDNEGEPVRSGDVLDKYEFSTTPMWVHTALEDWRVNGFISGRGTIGDEKNQRIRFTGQGLIHAEAMLNIPQYQPTLRQAERQDKVFEPVVTLLAPASDRIVRLDHNDPELENATENASSLVAALKTSNDVGALDSEARQVAIREVEEIVAGLKSDFVRLPAFGDRAKSTLGWIGRQAASALVGAAALALLALLAHLIGFSV